MDKITIKYLEGCGYSMEINGTEFVDLSVAEQREVCQRIISNDMTSHDMLVSFIETYFECDAEIVPNEYKCINEDEPFPCVNRQNIECKAKETLQNECIQCLESEDCSEATMQWLIERFTETYGKTKHLGYCTTCGSYNYEYSITI